MQWLVMCNPKCIIHISRVIQKFVNKLRCYVNELLREVPLAERSVSRRFECT